MVQTVSKLRDELGHPAELVHDLVSEGRDQVLDLAGAATKSGKKGVRKARKSAKRQAKHLSKSINPPKAVKAAKGRKLSTPLALLVVVIVVAALIKTFGGAHRHEDTDAGRE
jgi:hypothetical protein